MRAQIANHAFKVGKPFAVDGKRGVAILVVDVEVDDISGDSLFAECPRHFTYARLWVVTVPALLVAERPEWRQGSAPCELGEFLEHLFRARAVEKVVVQLAALGAKRVEGFGLLSEIKAAAVGVVEENAVSDAAPQRQEKRDRFIEWIGGLLPTKRIRVPHGESLLATVHWARLVSQTVVILIRRHGLPNAHLAAFPGHRQVRIVLLGYVFLRVCGPDVQRRLLPVNTTAGRGARDSNLP